MNTRQIVAKNMILQIFLQPLHLLAGVYSISLIARYLGKASFGKYGFIWSFYIFFISFLDFGISIVGTREVAKDRQSAGLLLGNIVTFKLYLSILLTLLAISIVQIVPFPYDLKLALTFYAPILIFFALESIQIIFEADLRFEYFALSSVLWRASSLLFLILTIRLNLGLAFIAASFLLAEIVKYLTLYVFSKRFIKIKVPTADIGLWLKLVKSALPIGITSLLGTVIRNTDVMLLTKMKGFVQVGLYTASTRLCDISFGLPLALMGSMFPLMSKYYKQDLNTLRRIHQKTFDILSVCGILLTVLVLALADKIIILLFGPDFVRSAIVFRILIFSVLSVYLAIGSGSLIVAADKQTANMRFYMLVAPLSIILNLILIPPFGIIGAAISNVVAMFSAVSLTFYFVNNKLKIPLEITKLKKAIIAGLITLAILVCLKSLNLFISLFTGICLYGFLVIFLKAIDRDDIMLLINKPNL
jgi:O-antigen/teichoic acid export membrane protein